MSGNLNGFLDEYSYQIFLGKRTAWDVMNVTIDHYIIYILSFMLHVKHMSDTLALDF